MGIAVFFIHFYVHPPLGKKGQKKPADTGESCSAHMFLSCPRAERVKRKSGTINSKSKGINLYANLSLGRRGTVGCWIDKRTHTQQLFSFPSEGPFVRSCSKGPSSRWGNGPPNRTPPPPSPPLLEVECRPGGDTALGHTAIGRDSRVNEHLSNIGSKNHHSQGCFR